MQKTISEHVMGFIFPCEKRLTEILKQHEANVNETIQLLKTDDAKKVVKKAAEVERRKEKRNG